MAEQKKERVWTFDETAESATSCSACGSPFHAGESVVTCPRCRGVHHLSCWTSNGGCSTHGCSQLSDPSLLEGKPRSYDPPTKDSFAWVPLALTILLITLVAGGAIWNAVRGQSTANTLSVMVPADSDFATIQQSAKQFDEKSEKLGVSVLSIPTDNPLYYEEKLVIMLVARDAPDIVFLPYDRFTFYVEQGALAQLDDIKSELANTIPYKDRLNNGIYKGNLYGVPHPSKEGLFAIPLVSKKHDSSRQLLLDIVQALPFKAGIDDKAIAKQ